MLYNKKLSIMTMLGLLTAFSAHADNWSDTALSFRHGEKFREPFNSKNITKNIFALTHASGSKYGNNFFNVDLLQSDRSDPTTTTGETGAQEAYALYRYTLDIGKVRGTPVSLGPISGVGITAGFDWNTKNDSSYQSKKRMLVLGPTLSWAMPGFLSTGIVLLRESNAPLGMKRYTYKIHPALNIAWGIPMGATPFAFEGFANFIAKKGNDEFGNKTGAETNIDMQIMWDMGQTFGITKSTFRAGLEYQYWHNKFGNTMDTTRAAGGGSTASTPMGRLEYHF